MNRPTVLVIGSRDKQFITALEAAYTIIHAGSGREAIAQIDTQPPQAIILDAAAMRTTGTRICRRLRETLAHTPIVHIHPGPAASSGDQIMGVVVVVAPVTARYIMTTLASLLQTNTTEIIACGPFCMDTQRRVLLAHGRETQLTPKVAHLLEIFLRHPGETLDRKTLMEQVWDTSYLGDTRTLNVHIRWVRDALSNGVDHQYLKTVRGTGYRLVVPEAH